MSKKDIYKDERFAHLLKNPRFKTIPKKETKIKIDNRFKSMFENEKFNIQYNVDKYGRKVNKKSAENLKNYYELASSESSSEDEEVEIIPGNAIIKGGNKMPEKLKDKLKDMNTDYIRGEGILQSDSSDEETSEDDEEIIMEHNWGELDADAERTEESTRRIACMHMDWDRIRAVDIMVLCNSFIPAGAGSILSVKIYPSEFGKERMAEEEINGPKEITAQNVDSEENQVDEENEEFVEKLREYQLNRLKYYYAVVEFDSIKCADIVYKECDGLEYESTSNRLDLRFIPDDMEFDDEPKDSCTELPDFSKYEPRIFFTTALQHAKVELTWDETDISRKELSEKLFSENGKGKINDKELRNYVAFSSESENESEAIESDNNENIQDTGKKNKIELYKSLLEEINQKENEKKKRQVEMEYSWGIGGSNDKKKASTDDNIESELHMTPFETILEKKKQKKKAKKEMRAKKLQNDDEEHEDEYSSSDFDDIDMNDPYFAEEFENDEFKKPKLKKKIKKNKSDTFNDSEEEEKMKTQNELELLLHDDDDNEKSHFSLKKIQESEDTNSKKKKRKLKKLKKKGINVEHEEVDDNFKLNIQDERFSAVFSQPEFNIDPTNPSFKKTKGMEKIIEEKIKRRHNDDNNTTTKSVPEKKQKINDASLKILVKSIKRKVGK